MASTNNKQIPRKISRMAAVMPSLEGIDKEARTVTFTLSTEAAIEDWPGEKMILEHSDEAVDMSRMLGGGPLLFNHDRSAHLGRIIAAEVTDRKLIVTAKFSNSELGREKFQDVVDGILAEASVSASLQKVVLESTSDEGDTYRATRWTPLEASLVTVPADITVGIGRDAKTHADDYIQISNTMSEENKDSKPPVEAPKTVERATPVAAPVIEFKTDPQVIDRASKEERQRVSEIHRLASSHKVEETVVRDYVDNGKPLASFQHFLLTEHYQAAPIETSRELGMSNKEKKEYSLVRALRQLATPGKQLDGIEREASDAMAKNLKREARGFFIPTDMAEYDDTRVSRALHRSGVSRALSAGVASEGGYTVATDTLGGSLIELLRNRTLMAGLGVRQLSGLQGNVAIPKQASGATSYWLGETEQVPESALSFGEVLMTPKRLAAYTAHSKQLLAQSSIDVEALVRSDLMSVLALAKDLAALNGSGAGGEPLGIINTTGVNTVTFSGAPTFAKMVEFQTAVAEDNADIGSMAYLTTAPTAGKLKTTSKDTGSGQFLWNGRLDGGEVDGYTARVSQQMPGNKVLFGAFGNAIMGDWDGMDITVDPFTLARTGQIAITVHLMTDFAVRHAESFCVSTDAGNQ